MAPNEHDEKISSRLASIEEQNRTMLSQQKRIFDKLFGNGSDGLISRVNSFGARQKMLIAIVSFELVTILGAVTKLLFF